MAHENVRRVVRKRIGDGFLYRRTTTMTTIRRRLYVARWRQFLAIGKGRLPFRAGGLCVH